MARSTARGLLTLAAAALIGTTVAGCAGTQAQQPPPAVVQPSPTQQFNDTDVQFAQQMIAHHQQALMMAQMAAGRAASAQVKQLAAQIGQEQAPEIEQMSAWLTQWGKPVPSMGPGMTMPSMPPMGPGAMPSMPAMPDMGQMNDMTGEQFDNMFLQMMIAHHQGAVEMAKAEIANGANPAAKELAQKIETSQTAQIEQMRQLLGATPSPTS
ncbi:DUF305 domain-containing protein [Catellatospora bangladeshensis]|uniref:DUF305 domain-containing protein n=1 Tax=Catellatospora bangladeshensis TaxID=310355 RepID=A0A8J3JKH8_9ACTN|nr:DUF305 domain-containing protein [Catellatospora bangladeshensis]GIF82132.1 hypothetical protein Cba03nite_34810 [Catellatospora bangladeshensis]